NKSTRRSYKHFGSYGAMIEKQKCERSSKATLAFFSFPPAVNLRTHRFDYRKNHQQRKEHQRLNQRQTQNHHGLNAAGGSRIPRRAFTGGRAYARLSNRPAKNRNREPDAGSEGH